MNFYLTKLKQNGKFNFFLFLIILISFTLRFFALSALPNGFHVDEINAGYIGKYILMHGQDIYGNKLPLYVDSFGDFRPAGIFYLTGFGALVFGANEFGVRILPAFFGIVTIIAFYYFCLVFTENKKVSLFSAFFLSILPWHIVLSRATSEAVVGLFLVIAGLLFIFRYIKSGKKYLLFLAFCFLFSSYFFYHSFRFLVPFVVLPLILEYRGQNKIKPLVIIFSSLLLLSIIIGFTKAGNGRFSQVAFYNNPNLALTSERLIQGEGINNILSARLFHNKGILGLREFVKQYLSYFSPQFIFNEGGFPLRYQIPEQGLLPYIFLPLIFAGLLLNRGNIDQKRKYYLTYLLLIAPFPSALTFEDSPNVHRSLFLMIPLVLLAGSGFYEIIFFLRKSKLKKVLSIMLILTILFLEEIYFLHQYITHSGPNRSVVRNDGNKELSLYILNHNYLYNKIYLPNMEGLPTYILFYGNKYDVSFKGYSGNYSLENLSFIEKTECPSEKIDPSDENKKILIVDYGNCKLPSNLKIIHSIYRKDYTLAYRIMEKNY